MPDAPENQPEDIAPLLRIGLEEDADDAQAQDVDATIRVTVPTPRTGSTGGSGGRSRGWNPPSVEELQKMLPQYEISAFIARGGMGAVYKGQQKTLKRSVAIKVLPPEIEDGDAQFAARFKHEAQAMAQLSHPNIVAVFDAGETPDGLLYFVMEFIEGTDVAQLIASEGQLEPRRAIQITTAVCEALAFAHEEGIIHRDIKPSNIMIDRKGRVKVADFGLAKTVNVEQTLLTGTNMALGTPDFIAPEALIPGMKVDQRADIYAVGVMLYQMLTGHIPRGRFELPSGVMPQVDKGFDPIVDKAMQTDREKRYSSAMEMKTAVECVVTVNAHDGSAGTSARSHSDGGEAARKNEAGKNRSEAEIASRRLPEGRAERGNARAPLKSRAPLLVGTAAVLLVGGVAWMLLDEPTAAQGLPKSEAAKPAGITSLASTTKDAPFVNSLGMKFMPVPIIGGPTGGQRVLFSVWETRVKDYRAFVAATKRQWDFAQDLPQGAEYPALDVSWHDAVAFCEWLTAKEQKAGLIGSQARYRLPSDHEWSCAAGNEYEDADKLPAEKTIKRPIYPWGTAWPPPDGENLRGEEAAGSKTGSGLEVITGHRDPYPLSAPVGLSKPSEHGIFDLGGNAGEWCADWYDASQKERVSRGATINSGNRIISQSDYRAHYVPEMHASSNGFRVVLAETEGRGDGAPAATVSAPSASSATTRDRAAALHMLAKGCTVFVREDGKNGDLSITSAAALPAAPFAVMMVVFAHGPQRDFSDADLEHLSGLPKLHNLQLAGTRITGAGLAQLKSLPALKRLLLDDNRALRDADLAHLKACPKLEDLTLFHSSMFTAAALEHVAGIEGLESFGLSVMRLTDAHVPHLLRLQRLQALNLGGTGLGAKAIEQFHALPRLAQLNFSTEEITQPINFADFPALRQVLVSGNLSTTISDSLATALRLESLTIQTPGELTGKALAKLAAATKQLKELILLLDQPLPPGESLAALAALPALQRVSLAPSHAVNQFDDAALLSLAKVPALRSVKLGGGANAIGNYQHRVTSQGLAEFKKQRPDVNIEGAVAAASATTPQ